MLAQEQFDQLTARMLTDRGLCARVLGALETHDQAYVKAMHEIYVSELENNCVTRKPTENPCRYEIGYREKC